MIVRSSQLASDKEMKDYTKQVKLNAFGYKIIKIKLQDGKEKTIIDISGFITDNQLCEDRVA